MKEGDKVKWRSVNATCSGIITKNENGEWIVDAGNGMKLPLGWLSQCKSFSLIQD